MLELIQTLIKDMELPSFRKDQDTLPNMKWLFKNLAKRNSGHPNYASAMVALKRLLGR